MIRRPPRSTRTDTLCPYTTLFRSPTPWLAVMPVDVLNLPVNMVARLAGAADAAGALIAYASTADPDLDVDSAAAGPRAAGLKGPAPPLCRVLPARLAARLRTSLLAADRQVPLWQARRGAVAVSVGC